MNNKLIPAYVYQQYADDAYMQGIFAAYNSIAQDYLDWFANIGLPIYTGLSGPLLDWVATGLYGIIRPTLQTAYVPNKGPFASVSFAGGVPYAGGLNSKSQSTTVTDDIYKRIITWSFYKGDGQVFNIPWLKRRVIRFLYGTSGQDVAIASVYGVGVTMSTVSGVPTITITMDTSKLYAPQTNLSYGNNGGTAAGATILQLAYILQQALNSGVCPLPFNFSYTVAII